METVKCWNCGSICSQSSIEHCEVCYQPVSITPTNVRVVALRVMYLLREVSTWDFIPLEVKNKILSRYRAKLRCLRERVSAYAEGRATIDTTDVSRNEAGSHVPGREPEEETVAAVESSSWIEAVRSVLREHALPWIKTADIRWFHTVGALLLLSACIGYLRANWNGVGRHVVGLLLFAAPFLCFWVARYTKHRLPLTSRIFSLMASMLLPTGLLALNHFHILGLDLPFRAYDACSLLIATTAMWWQVIYLEEITCLYLSGISLVTSACYFSAWFGTSVAGGLVCLAGAVAVLGYAWRNPGFHKRHFMLVGQTLGLLAAVSPGPWVLSNESVPLIPMFLATLLFGLCAGLNEDDTSLYLSAGVALASVWIYVYTCALPSLILCFFAVVLGSIYYLAGLSREDGSCFRRATLKLGLGIPVLVVFPFLWYQLVTGIGDNFSRYTRVELLGIAFLAMLCSGLIFYVSWREEMVSALYVAVFCGAYSYLALMVSIFRENSGYYALLIQGFPAAVMGLAVLLRGRVRERYLKPWIYCSFLVAALGVGYALLLVMKGNEPYSGVEGIGFALAGVAFFLGTIALQRTEPLYVAFACAGLAYGQFAGLLGIVRDVNYGVAFLPFVFVSALLAEKCGSKWGSEYSTAIRNCFIVFLGLGWGSQFYYGFEGQRLEVSVGLGGYGVLLLWSAYYYSKWWTGREIKGAVLLGAGSIALAAAPWPWGYTVTVVGGFVLVVTVGLFEMFSCPKEWRTSLLRSPVVYPLAIIVGDLMVDCLSPESLLKWWVLYQTLLLLVWWLEKDRNWGAAVKTSAVFVSVIALLIAVGGDYAWTTVLCWWFVVSFGVAALAKRDVPMFAVASIWLVIALHRAAGELFPLSISLIGMGMLWGTNGCLRHYRAWIMRYTTLIAILAMMSGLWGGFVSIVEQRLVVLYVIELLVVAMLWCLRASFGGTPVSYVGAFISIYCAYGLCLCSLDIRGMELYTLPLAGWCFYWGHKFSGKAGFRDSWCVLGGMIALGPSLAASCGFSGWEHAVWVGISAGSMVVVGVLLHDQTLKLIGSIGLVAEVVIQMFHLSVVLPWQLTAVILGLMFVGLGYLFEKYGAHFMGVYKKRGEKV